MTQRLHAVAVTPAYWRITFDNPPINLYDPEMFAALRQLAERMENDPALQVVVFDSADPDFFIAHYDVLRGSELPDLPGAAPFTAWPAFVTRLAQSRVVSIASIRGCARGHRQRRRAVVCQPELPGQYALAGRGRDHGRRAARRAAAAWRFRAPPGAAPGHAAAARPGSSHQLAARI